jgi:ATP-dependent DNA helicase RecG
MAENQHIEWKVSWRDEYLKWICAFANAQGGVLEVGRDNNGKVVGLNNAAKIIKELPNKMRDLLGIVADVDLLEEDGKSFVRITVEPRELWFELPFSKNYLKQLTDREGSGRASGATTQKTTQKTTQEKILDVLREDATVSRRRIAKRLGGITENGVKCHLGKLKDAGRIRRIGPDRGGRWEVLGDDDE